jgi:hypothetical protein
MLDYTCKMHYACKMYYTHLIQGMHSLVNSSNLTIILMRHGGLACWCKQAVHSTRGGRHFCFCLPLLM